MGRKPAIVAAAGGRSVPPGAGRRRDRRRRSPPVAAEPALGAAPEGFTLQPPVLDTSVIQVYLPVEVCEREAVRQLNQAQSAPVEVTAVQLGYQPELIGVAEVRFTDRRRNIDQQVKRVLLAPAPDDLRRFDWGEADSLSIAPRDLLDDPDQVDEAQGPFFGIIPEGANSGKEIVTLKKMLVDWLYANSKQPLIVHKELGLFQQPDEPERQFKSRLQQAAREARDAEVDKLAQKI